MGYPRVTWGRFSDKPIDPLIDKYPFFAFPRLSTFHRVSSAFKSSSSSSPPILHYPFLSLAYHHLLDLIFIIIFVSVLFSYGLFIRSACLLLIEIDFGAAIITLCSRPTFGKHHGINTPEVQELRCLGVQPMHWRGRRSNPCMHPEGTMPQLWPLFLGYQAGALVERSEDMPELQVPLQQVHGQWAR